jgi:hypothetical protein
MNFHGKIGQLPIETKKKKEIKLLVATQKKARP